MTAQEISTLTDDQLEEAYSEANRQACMYAAASHLRINQLSYRSYHKQGEMSLCIEKLRNIFPQVGKDAEVLIQENINWSGVKL